MSTRRDILENIFDLLLSDKSDIPAAEYQSSHDLEPHIIKKIDDNFSSHQKTIMMETFTSLLPDINAIGSLFEEQFKLDPLPARRMVNRIRHIFLKIINSNPALNTNQTASTEIPINDFQIINDIADELIKSYKRSFSVEEMSAVQSVILCVFELCDIGKLPLANNKFKNPKRIIDPTFWDDMAKENN